MAVKTASPYLCWAENPQILALAFLEEEGLEGGTIYLSLIHRFVRRRSRDQRTYLRCAESPGFALQATVTFPLRTF